MTSITEYIDTYKAFRGQFLNVIFPGIALTPAHEEIISAQHSTWLKDGRDRELAVLRGRGKQGGNPNATDKSRNYAKNIAELLGLYIVKKDTQGTEIEYIKIGDKDIPLKALTQNEASTFIDANKDAYYKKKNSKQGQQEGQAGIPEA